MGSPTAMASTPESCSSGSTRCQYHASPPAPGISTKVAGTGRTLVRTAVAHLGEAVRQPAHPHHQRCRRTRRTLEITGELVTRNTDAGGELLQAEAGPLHQHVNVA